MTGEQRPPEITFDTASVDSILLFRGRTLNTGDLSPEGLYAFVEQHEASIMEYMELLDKVARRREYKGPSLDRPSVYLAWMAINPKEVLVAPDPRATQFTKPEELHTGHNRRCFQALEKTHFDAFAGIVHAQSVYDGVWLGIQEPRRPR